MPLESLPLFDHHCHGVVTTDLDRSHFEALMNEGDAPGPFGTTYFDSMLGVAVRRWCAPVLDLEPHASPDDYLARRHELGTQEVNTRFLTAAGLGDLGVDTGLDSDRVTDPQTTAAYGGARGHEIVRLEALSEELLAAGTPTAAFPDALRERLTDGGYLGAKSIAAYRVGLDLLPDQPTPDELVRALDEIVSAGGRLRIAHPVVNGWLAHEAVALGLPLQLHVGYGDNDVDLAECDPLRLTPFLRSTQDRGVAVLLLHNYPFHRQAGYLAQVFPHVFMDLGLATHNTGALSGTVIRESLELVPFAKMLYSSDAFGLSELYHLGALLFRRGLSGVLQSLVDEGEMSQADAESVGDLVGRQNALRAYGIR